MTGMETAARTVFDASVVRDWLTALQLQWLPRHPADRPGRTVDPDGERLVELASRWEQRLADTLDDPYRPLGWSPDPADPRSVQVVDAYLAGFALSLAAGLTIPPDPDIEDSQPIVVATALAGAAAMLEQLEQFDGVAVTGSAAQRASWLAELTTATSAGHAAVDVGSSGGSLAAATRGAALVAADLALGRNGPGYQIAALIQTLADVVQPPAEPDESRSRYDVRCTLGLPGCTTSEAADLVRRTLRLHTDAGTVLELDVEPDPGVDGVLVRVLTRRAGAVVEAILELGRPTGLQIEVR